MIKKTNTFFLRLMFFSSVLMPLPAFSLDLAESLARAQQYDATFQADYAIYMAAIESRPQSLAALLPDVNLNLFSQKTDIEISRSTGLFTNTKNDFTTDGYSVTLKQPIYNQQLFNLFERSDALVSQALANFETAKQDLITRVATAYFNVLAAQDNLDFATAERKTNERLLEQAQERFKVGLIAITDVKDVQARHDTSVAQEIVAENLLSNTREELWVIIDADASNPSPLHEKIPLAVPTPEDITAWKDSAIAGNLTLRAAKYAVEAAEQAYDSSRAGHYPSLDFSAGYTSSSANGSSFGFGGRDTDETIYGLSLNVPIYSGGLTSSKIRESASLLSQTKAQHDRARRVTIQQSRTAYLGVIASISQVKALKQALTSTQTADEATQAGYEVGTRTSVDVLQVQSNLFKSERDYARSRYDYILNILKLKQSSGTLSADDIEEINQWLVH